MRRKHALRLVSWAAVLVWASPLAGQITGVVVDTSGRPLPNAVVVSRTGNGFLATRTDVQGRFAYPGRPHRQGHTIEASSAGFRGTVLRLEGDEEQIVLTLQSGGDPGPGWTLGLPVGPEILITDSSGTTVSPRSLIVGRGYLFVVSMRAAHCTQASDAVTEELDDEVVVAIAAFTRTGACSSGDARITVPYRFTRVGDRTIRVVGRNRDTRLRISIVAIPES